MASVDARYIVTGLFERAKRYWTIAVLGKIAVACFGFFVAVRPSFASAFGLAILVAEAAASTCFYRADALKSQAEPVLMRLDFDESLGWLMPKDYVDELSADFAKFKDKGQRIRAGDAYFAPGETMIGLTRLQKNLLESALYTRTIAAAARNVYLYYFYDVALRGRSRLNQWPLSPRFPGNQRCRRVSCCCTADTCHNGSSSARISIQYPTL